MRAFLLGIDKSIRKPEKGVNFICHNGLSSHRVVALENKGFGGCSTMCYSQGSAVIRQGRFKWDAERNRDHSVLAANCFSLFSGIYQLCHSRHEGHRQRGSTVEVQRKCGSYKCLQAGGDVLGSSSPPTGFRACPTAILCVHSTKRKVLNAMDRPVSSSRQSLSLLSPIQGGEGGGIVYRLYSRPISAGFGHILFGLGGRVQHLSCLFYRFFGHDPRSGYRFSDLSFMEYFGDHRHRAQRDASFRQSLAEH
jgi:hypothetical protein